VRQWAWGGVMKTVYQEVTLDDVLAHFAMGYNHKKNGELLTHESFVDISKRKVVFKLNFRDDDAQQGLAD
jgi:hypothetical protein